MVGHAAGGSELGVVNLEEKILISFVRCVR
jgi:hypothetical protein